MCVGDPKCRHFPEREGTLGKENLVLRDFVSELREQIKDLLYADHVGGHHVVEILLDMRASIECELMEWDPKLVLDDTREQH